MPVRTRSQPPVQSSVTVDPAVDTSPPARRSKRLRHDDTDLPEIELPLRKRRRKKADSSNRASVKESNDESVEDVRNAGARTTEKTPNRRQAASNLRVDTLRKNANRSSLGSGRRVTENTSEDADRPARAVSRRRSNAQPRRAETAESESEHIMTVHDIPASPRARAKSPSSRYTFGEDDGLFVAADSENLDHSQDADKDYEDGDHDEHADEDLEEELSSDAELYDDATVMATSMAPRHQEDALEEQLQNTQQLRDMVEDMGPNSREASPEPPEDVYPIDHHIFNAPTGHDISTCVTLKSNIFRHMAGLMNGRGWRYGADKTTRKLPLSGHSRHAWDIIVQLRDFWGNMPRAPEFAEQCRYLHYSDEASKAQDMILRIDEFVHATRLRAMKISVGDERSMVQKTFVVDLYEKIIPLLVDNLHGVYQRGLENDTSSSARFTKLTLQIMERLMAWIDKLYAAMLGSMARRPRGQTGSQKISRQKLRPYLMELEALFKDTMDEIDSIPQQRRRYDEAVQRRERERLEAEEKNRRQRELVRSRIAERMRKAPQSAASQTVMVRPASRQNQTRGSSVLRRGTAPQMQRLETVRQVATTRQLSDEDIIRLWKILLARPRAEIKDLANLFECSIAEMGEAVRDLKEAVRNDGERMNRPIPEFATV